MEQQSEAEKAAITNKLFDCAEAPIKEWIAEFIGEDPSVVFNDYTDDVDLIGFQENDKHYNAYLVTLDCDVTSNVNPELLKSSEKARKACSMLFDGTYQVFASVLQVVKKRFFDQLRNLRPMFDEPTMSFKLIRINGAAAQLKAALEQKAKAITFLAEAKDPLSVENQEKVDSFINGLNDIIVKNSKEVLDAEESICIETNKKLETYDKLCIVVEESNADGEGVNGMLDSGDLENADKLLSRLPTFGLNYQDPDEENYIDKLKKEYEVN
jgi:hypothetical protein